MIGYFHINDYQELCFIWLWNWNLVILIFCVAINSDFQSFLETYIATYSRPTAFLSYYYYLLIFTIILCSITFQTSIDDYLIMIFAPRNPHVSTHGLQYSGWQSNPERTLLSPPWLQVDCCPRWPAHNESFINALCGHQIHEGCLLTLNCPHSMAACPICTSRATHYKREGQFLLPLICFMSILVTERHVDSVLPCSGHRTTAS